MGRPAPLCWEAVLRSLRSKADLESVSTICKQFLRISNAVRTFLTVTNQLTPRLSTPSSRGASRPSSPSTSARSAASRPPSSSRSRGSRCPSSASTSRTGSPSASMGCARWGPSSGL
ncbi:hypothetical protein NL676_009718 [Syzygium grande]|nr:hypothetical protein NL676_009718 [Syzygium grande]